MCDCGNDTPRMRAVRAATSVTTDDPALVRDAITELLTTLMTINAIDADDVISAMFTATPDLRSAFPATAARTLGWTDVPMLCATEIDVPGAPPRILRVMLHVERATSAPPLVPVYLHDAAALRPEHAAEPRPAPRMASAVR